MAIEVFHLDLVSPTPPSKSFCSLFSHLYLFPGCAFSFFPSVPILSSIFCLLELKWYSSYNLPCTKVHLLSPLSGWKMSQKELNNYSSHCPGQTNVAPIDSWRTSAPESRYSPFATSHCLAICPHTRAWRDRQNFIQWPQGVIDEKNNLDNISPFCTLNWEQHVTLSENFVET